MFLVNKNTIRIVMTVPMIPQIIAFIILLLRNFKFFTDIMSNFPLIILFGHGEFFKILLIVSPKRFGLSCLSYFSLCDS